MARSAPLAPGNKPFILKIALKKNNNFWLLFEILWVYFLTKNERKITTKLVLMILFPYFWLHVGQIGCSWFYFSALKWLLINMLPKLKLLHRIDSLKWTIKKHFMLVTVLLLTLFRQPLMCWCVVQRMQTVQQHTPPNTVTWLGIMFLLPSSSRLLQGDMHQPHPRGLPAAVPPARPADLHSLPGHDWLFFPWGWGLANYRLPLPPPDASVLTPLHQTDRRSSAPPHSPLPLDKRA